MDWQLAVRDIPEHTVMTRQCALVLEETKRLSEIPGVTSAEVGAVLDITRQQKKILISGALDQDLKLPCDRCLETFDYAAQPSFELQLFPMEEQTFEEEQVLSQSELDFDFYEGDTIDLLQVIEDQLLLSLPFKALCSDTCQGLCSGCGALLAQESCSCEQSQQESPFSQVQ